MKECPHCQRKFLNTVAERHIPHCATMKHKAKPPPTKNELIKRQGVRRSMYLKTKQNTPGSKEMSAQKFSGLRSP